MCEEEEQRDVLCFTHAVFLLSVTVNSERLDATEHFLDWYLFIYTLSVFFFKRLSIRPTPPTLLPSAFSTCAFPPRFSVLLPALFYRPLGGMGRVCHSSSLLLSSSCYSSSAVLLLSLFLFLFHMLCSKGWAPVMSTLPELL